MNEQQLYEKCVIKTLDMDKDDLFNLIKNIMVEHPETMNTIDEY